MMMKRLLILLTLIWALSWVLPAAAQPDDIDYLSWIPADFAGVMRLETQNRESALNVININLLVGSVLQPARAHAPVTTFDAVFPVAAFDMETATFDALIASWLGNEIVIGYRALDAQLRASSDDIVMILPTGDPFQSLSVMRSALNAQDLLEQSEYRGVTIYVGDETAFAFMPTAVIIADEPLIRATLDTALDDAPHLIDSEPYQTVVAALSENTPRTAGQVRMPPLFIYFTGDAAAYAPRALLSAAASPTGRAEADVLFDALLGAVGNLTMSNLAPDLAPLREGSSAEATPEPEATVEATAEATPEATSESASTTGDEAALSPERALLSGAADAIGIGLSFDTLSFSTARADVIIHTSTPVASSDADFNAALLEFVPRSAMLVQSGDADRAVYTALAGLPLANFAGVAFSALPIVPSAGSQVLPTPTAEDVSAAVEGFLTMIGESGVNLRGDVLEHLNGSYILALLPRPNNPTPTLNTPFDVLVVAEVDSEMDTITEGMTNTLRLLFGDDAVETGEITVRGQAFDGIALSNGVEAVLRIVPVDNWLVIGTGDAVTQALNAYIGDNRLIEQDRWTDLTGDDTVYFYADMPAVYNTFFPAARSENTDAVQQVGITSRTLTDDLLYLRMTVTLEF